MTPEQRDLREWEMQFRWEYALLMLAGAGLWAGAYFAGEALWHWLVSP